MSDKISRYLFIITCITVLIFTIFILSCFFCGEKPYMNSNGYVIPIVYSDNIIYFPCSGELYAKSLSKYVKDHNLDICGMASKNTPWTKGYIVAIRPGSKNVF